MKTKTILFILIGSISINTLLFQACKKEDTVLTATPFTDSRDGYIYKTIKIGNQIWFAENLKYETLNSWYYDNSPTNGNIYGKLYIWDDAITACPSGWHLPEDSEWKILEMNLGMSQNLANEERWRGNIASELKSTIRWNDNGNGSNSSGFTALPGGYRGINGVSYGFIGDDGSWWSVTEHSDTTAWYRGIYYRSDSVYRYHISKNIGFSVRCIKN